MKYDPQVILYIGQAKVMGYSMMNFCYHGNLTGYSQCPTITIKVSEYNQMSDAWLYTSDVDVMIAGCTGTLLINAIYEANLEHFWFFCQ